jgi:HPt (histidine-containing phosphotransfer) domain-containing protein
MTDIEADKPEIDKALQDFGSKAGTAVSLTLKDGDNFMQEIAEAVNTGNTQDAGRAAHSLKSIMRQLGCHTVADHAYSIEQAGRGDDLATCRDVLTQLQESYQLTRDYLNSKTG